MTIWREIWMDGRALPTNVGGRGRDAHDPTYNGYSVGRWEDDYTFVAQTTIDGVATGGFEGLAIHTAAVPEPSTMALFGVGGVGFLLYRRRRKKPAS